MAQEYLTVQEYSERTGISVGSLYRNFKNGKLPNATKIGGRIIIIEWVEDKPSERFLEQKEAMTDAIKHIRDGYNELLDVIENM